MIWEFFCKTSQLHLFVATNCISEKYINYNKNIELNINKTTELKNSIYKKRRQGCDSLLLNKVKNFKCIQNFQWKIHFSFLWIVQRVHNTFMVKVGSFTVYFRTMPFWVTSLFKNVPYDITLTCNYDMSIVILWWFFCNIAPLFW